MRIRSEAVPEPRPREEIWWTREWFAAQFWAAVELVAYFLI